MYNFFFDRIFQSIDNVDAPFAFLDGGAQATYSALLAWSAKYANALVQLGLQPGDLVASPLCRDIDRVFFYVAVLRAGGVFVPTDGSVRLDRVDGLTAAGGARVFVCIDAELSCENVRPREVSLQATQRVARFCKNAELVELASRAQPRFQDAVRVASDAAVAFLDPEPTILSHQQLASEAARVVALLRLTSADRLVQAIPVSDPYGFLLSANLVMLSNGSMYFYESFVGAQGEVVPRAATYVAGARGYYEELVASNALNTDNVRDIRAFLTNQSAFPVATQRRFTAMTGRSIMSNFGL